MWFFFLVKDYKRVYSSALEDWSTPTIQNEQHCYSLSETVQLWSQHVYGPTGSQHSSRFFQARCQCSAWQSWLCLWQHYCFCASLKTANINKIGQKIFLDFRVKIRNPRSRKYPFKSQSGKWAKFCQVCCMWKNYLSLVHLLLSLLSSSYTHI